MILKILVLIGLIRLLVVTSKPFLCSGLYACVMFFFGLFIGLSFGPVLIASLISFGAASLYFWLLDKFEGQPGLWWTILIVGGFLTLLV